MLPGLTIILSEPVQEFRDEFFQRPFQGTKNIENIKILEFIFLYFEQNHLY